ncbi:hypothetical protein VTO42DRAFT_2049 [Malbranchea cinnamomea]
MDPEDERFLMSDENQELDFTAVDVFSTANSQIVNAGDPMTNHSHNLVIPNPDNNASQFCLVDSGMNPCLTGITLFPTIEQDLYVASREGDTENVAMQTSDLRTDNERTGSSSCTNGPQGRITSNKREPKKRLGPTRLSAAEKRQKMAAALDALDDSQKKSQNGRKPRKPRVPQRENVNVNTLVGSNTLESAKAARVRAKAMMIAQGSSDDFANAKAVYNLDKRTCDMDKRELTSAPFELKKSPRADGKGGWLHPDTNTSPFHYQLLGVSFMDNGVDPEVLNSIMKPFMLRRTHEDTLFGISILEMPDLEEQTISIAFTKAERYLYRALKSYLTLLLRLRMFTSHALVLSQGALQDFLTLDMIHAARAEIADNAESEDLETCYLFERLLRKEQLPSPEELWVTRPPMSRQLLKYNAKQRALITRFRMKLNAVGRESANTKKWTRQNATDANSNHSMASLCPACTSAAINAFQPSIEESKTK